ncbi:uncharacterized protein TRAVEDRAFT_22904 [Trametes versicolor FP-101664 SS1]|uniref:uncharacterized protein n=1 Tax=Trametes versicolor (strain FP-101664) TaxID=717944 RepID=UPI00046212DE|nr:uncharacterized protein TRAVEDRAFT_22904 [Trametes versicolor FP-101664 SS1]EIW55136.1 hypothetical protein TRAVEDRAFT_22904 [Trametes versicolor FP-101664 SS1]
MNGKEGHKFHQLHKICFEDDRTVERSLSQYYGSPRLNDALRYLSGAWAPYCPSAEDSALEHLRVAGLLQLPSESSWGSPPDAYDPQVKSRAARAHSLAAYAYYKKYMACPSPRAGVTPSTEEAAKSKDALTDLIEAARHANQSVCMQLLTPAVLLAGFAFRTFVEDRQLDMRDFLELRPLWRELERRKARWPERVGAALNFDFPSTKDPRACAAAGCKAVIPVGDGSVGQDIGKYCQLCSTEETPSYCSSECREQDWATHQMECRCPGTLHGPLFTSYACLGQQRDVLKGMAERVGYCTHVEVMRDDEDRHDLLNGSVVWEKMMPCPLGIPLKVVKIVLKEYSK